MSSNFDSYNNEIRQRSLTRFVKGLIPRVYIYLKFAYNRFVARRGGRGNWQGCYDAIVVST